ncbi:MAG: ATPase domain-containing protein [Thermoplasmata archaeon]
MTTLIGSERLVLSMEAPAAPPLPAEPPAPRSLMAPANVLERCATGIEGLDDILGGGIPRGNMVLVAGSVGTGKTTLCLEFLVRGAERGERSLFLSVTEASQKLIQNLSTFEFFRPDLVSDGSLVFVDLPNLYDKLGLEREELTPDEIDILIRTIHDLVKTLGVKRLVLDSLTSVCYRIRRDEAIRDFMLRLGQSLSALGCTSLLVSEIGPTAGRYSMHGVEEAIVDGVILLWNTRRQGDILRVLQIVKMRGTAHSRAQYVIELTPIGLLMAPHLKGSHPEGA